MQCIVLQGNISRSNELVEQVRTPAKFDLQASLKKGALPWKTTTVSGASKKPIVSENTENQAHMSKQGEILNVALDWKRSQLIANLINTVKKILCIFYVQQFYCFIPGFVCCCIAPVLIFVTILFFFSSLPSCASQVNNFSGCLVRSR
jgi:hypothetical protein